MEMFIAALSAMLGMVGSVLTNNFNRENVQQTNETNENINLRNLEFQDKWNTEQLDWVKSMAQQTWEREDTAHQREVADLQAAGLSPLAALGGAQASNPLGFSPSGSPGQIPMETFRMPQFDTSSMANALLQAEELSETKRKNRVSEDNRATELKYRGEELKMKAYSLDIENKEVEQTIKYQSSLIELENNRLAEVVRNHKENEKIELSKLEQEKVEYESKRFYEEIKHQAGGEDIPYHKYTDFDAYLTARQIRLEAYNDLIDNLGLTREATSKQRNGKTGIGLQVPGLGGANTDVGGGFTDSEYKDLSEKQKAMYQKFLYKYPVPVYYPE